MAASTLIGTAPDQVPTNGDLGDLAFQNKESVEFTDGKGALRSFNLVSFEKELSTTALDVFVYDTSKDSDGGAWRSKCQHTSWFNEPLNTDTRGSRKEFPSVAILVATNQGFYIYDGDNPDTPLWMSFIQDPNGSRTYWTYANEPTFIIPYLASGTYGAVTSVSALNGNLVFGVRHLTDSSLRPNGVVVVNMISEQCITHSNAATYYWPSDIAHRNTQQYRQSGFGTVIRSGNVNDVDLAILPDCFIDPISNLPIPTIAVATGSGISIIKGDKTVVSAETANNTVVSASFLSNTHIVADTGGYPYVLRLDSLPFSTGNYMSTYLPDTPEKGWSHYSQAEGFGVPIYVPNGTNGTFKTAKHPKQLISLSDAGLGIIDEDLRTPSDSLYAIISNKFNSGWLMANTRGAWLSDTTSETIVGQELVANGTFNSDVASWTASNSTNEFVSNSLKITRTGGTGNTTYQAISCEPGRVYTLSATINSVGSRGDVFIGTSASGGSILSLVGTSGQTKTLIGNFTATQSTHYVVFAVDSASTYIIVDNVSVTLADVDRSINRKGLHVFGTITKTPVAEGSELVCYSNFGANARLEQAYNSALDFGTGDFSLTFWVNPNNQGSLGGIHLVFNKAGAGLAGTAFGVLGGSSGRLDLVIGGAQHSHEGILNYADIWQHVCVTRKGGVFYVYVNGALKITKTNTVDLTGVITNLVIGGYYYTGAYTGVNNKLALVRFAAKSHTADQIYKMYESEKVLFEDNAACTIYGSSSYARAAAFDEDLGLLHVGTDQGRSTFDGLRRVSNTTQSVEVAISAVNGLIVEE